MWLCSVARSCAPQDDVNEDYVCTQTISSGINRPPHLRPSRIYPELREYETDFTYSAYIFLQSKKLRRHNEAAIDLSNANSARGHKDIRRSTGHIAVITCYSDQQGSKSRQNPCQVKPTENIDNLSASRRRLWVRTTVSTVWSAAINIS